MVVVVAAAAAAALLLLLLRDLGGLAEGERELKGDHKNTFAPKLYLAAGDVKLSANASNFTAGAVRITAHFIKLTPPTS